MNVQLSLYGVDFLKQVLPELCRGADVDSDVQFKDTFMGPRGTYQPLCPFICIIT